MRALRRAVKTAHIQRECRIVFYLDDLSGPYALVFPVFRQQH